MQTQKEKSKKPQLVDYLKIIKVGKDKTLNGKALAGIDFSSYAFALEKYVTHLETEIRILKGA